MRTENDSNGEEANNLYAGLTEPPQFWLEHQENIILQITDKRIDVWSRPSCICTQISSPKKLFISLLWPKKILFLIFKKDIMQLFSVEFIEFSKKDFFLAKVMK